MVDAVLLDWEGVLADTGPARRDALLGALADEGVPFTAAAYDECCAGLDAQAGAAAALALAGCDDPTLAELVALRASRAFAGRLAHGFTLATGASRFVASTVHHTRLAIVTRARRAETELALRLSGLEGSMAVVVTADDVLDQPPAPAQYRRALAGLSRQRAMRAEHVVALVGATPAVRAARAAGVRTLAVGAPAHVALEADAAVDGIAGLSLDAVATLAGVRRGVRQP